MLEGQKELEQIIWLAPQAESADSLKEQERNVLHVFKLMKALLALGYGENVWTGASSQQMPSRFRIKTAPTRHKPQSADLPEQWRKNIRIGISA